MQSQTMETGSNAAAEPDEKALRAGLIAAIETRKLADAKARTAKATADRAEHLMREAGQKAEKLKADLEAASRQATLKHAKAISEAIRAGSPLPAAPAPAEADSAALNGALAHFHALGPVEIHRELITAAQA